MHRIRFDLTGKTFTRWTVLSFQGTSRKGSVWLCRCACGTEKTVTGETLRNGQSKSCGCLSVEMATARIKQLTTTHGHSTRGQMSPTYRSWRAMIGRCTNPANNRFDMYGGRGISICSEWGSFDAFLADMGERPAEKTLDRKDTNLGYFKDNCRWASAKEQNDNTRSNRKISFNGVEKTYTEWGRTLFNSETIIHKRKKAGWSDADALTLPPNCNNRVTHCQRI